MSETIGDGRGNQASGAQYIAGVTQDNFLMVAGSISSMPPVSTSLTGSIEVFSSTGSVNVYGNLSTTAGSEVYIKAGSVQTYNPIGIGSIWFGGGIGSVTITNSLPSIGSYTTQMVSGLASSIGISGAVNQGTNPWIVLGSFAQTNIGSVTITNSLPAIGSYTTQMVSGLASSIGISGAVNQGTNPWVISGIVNLGSNWGGTGSVLTIGSVSIANPSIIGSVQTQGVSGTAFNTVWLGTGSVLLSGTGVIAGSISVMNGLNLADAGSPSFKISTATASGTYTEVWAIGRPGSRLEVHGYHISTNAPGIVRLANSGTAPLIWATHYLNFQSGATIEKTFVMPIIPHVAGSPICFQTTSAGSTSVTIYGREVV